MKYIKAAVFVGIIALLFTLNAIFGWTKTLTDMGSLPVLQQALQDNLAKALLIYMALTMVSCAVLPLPGIVFAMAAGVLFGPFWGTAACSVATTLGACFAFLTGRYFLKDAVKPIVTKNKFIRRFFFEESRKNDMFLLMITRLVPVFPFNLQNYAYGITDIDFWPYAIYSLIFMLPGTAAYVFTTAGIVDSHNRFIYIAIGVVLLVGVAVVSYKLKKRSVRE